MQCLEENLPLSAIKKNIEQKSGKVLSMTLYKYKDCIADTLLYIENNYMKKLYIDELCKKSMLSKTYFSTLFKEYTGYTFIQYLNKVRIQKSIFLLQNTNLPITDICFEVGFNELSYYIKTFKAQIGISPNKYRNMTNKICIN
jgi:YesN/AraC family two-component response regulator